MKEVKGVTQSDLGSLRSLNVFFSMDSITKFEQCKKSVSKTESERTESISKVNVELWPMEQIWPCILIIFGRQG